jgi:ketosteroid isomerase-like protein
MTEEAMTVVKEFTEGLAGGNVRWDLIDPAVDVVDHDIPDADSYHGHDGFVKWIGDWGSAWESYEIQPERFVDSGDVVVSVFMMVARGKGSGVETRRRNATVNTVKDGLVTRVEYYSTEGEARQAAGLAAAER